MVQVGKIEVGLGLWLPLPSSGVSTARFGGGEGAENRLSSAQGCRRMEGRAAGACGILLDFLAGVSSSSGGTQG